MTRLGKRLRQAWPPTLRILRGESPLASPEVRPGSAEQPDRSSVTGLTSHRVLTALARESVAPAKRADERAGGKSTRCHATRSQAGPWSRSRRVVIKGEVSAQGGNPRVGVTDMADARPQVLYQHLDWARGHAAKESQDHQRSLQSARTSWHRFEAKQVRVWLHSAASGFLETLRREVFKTTPWAAATMETSQLRFRTLGARVPACTDRIKIS